jgi:hypothetical protein
VLANGPIDWEEGHGTCSMTIKIRQGDTKAECSVGPYDEHTPYWSCTACSKDGSSFHAGTADASADVDGSATPPIQKWQPTQVLLEVQPMPAAAPDVPYPDATGAPA